MGNFLKNYRNEMAAYIQYNPSLEKHRDPKLISKYHIYTNDKLVRSLSEGCVLTLLALELQ